MFGNLRLILRSKMATLLTPVPAPSDPGGYKPPFLGNHRQLPQTIANGTPRHLTMPFDPTKPVANTPNSAAEMRSQLNGLKDLIDLAAAGGVSGAQIDGVNTTDPVNPALAQVSLAGGVLHFSFTLPRGMDGQQGIQGPPFASVIIDSVTSLPPGAIPTVSAIFDGTNVHLSFGIPSGFNGNDGGPGPQGMPGEVSLAQLDAAIGGTSANSNAVSTLDTPFADPDAEAMRLKLNEFILAARR